MRIAVAGFMHESNTFNAQKADAAAFRSQSWVHGDDLINEWQDAHHEMGGFIEGVRKAGAELMPIVMAWATPSGPVTREVFEEIVASIIEGVRKTNPDSLLLSLHGAMVAEEHLDGDGEMV